jgi:hypothetical protein
MVVMFVGVLEAVEDNYNTASGVTRAVKKNRKRTVLTAV